MSKVKDLIIDRENQVIDLIRKMADFDDTVFDAWCELSLPYDDEDLDILFDVVTDEERFRYVISVGTEFLRLLSEGKDPRDLLL
jgi:hypothetical protein